MVDYETTGIDPKQPARKQQATSLTFKRFFEAEYFPWYQARYKSSARTVKSCINTHFTFLFNKPLNRVDGKEIENWQTTALQTLKPNTVNKGIYTVRGVLNKAIK